MTQDLVSTAPTTYTAMLGLIETAAAAQNPAVSVFAFELGQYEPGSYIMLHQIANHSWTVETLGSFTQLEHYDICGKVTVFSGDSPATNPSVATTVMSSTYTLFQATVMTPMMSNRTIPILGGSRQVYQMMPTMSQYTAGLGEIADQPAGWVGMIDFYYHFDAYITPG